MSSVSSHRLAATAGVAASPSAEAVVDFSHFDVTRVAGDYERYDEVHGLNEGQQVAIKFNLTSPDKVFNVYKRVVRSPIILNPDQMAQLVDRLKAASVQHPITASRLSLIIDRVNVASRLIQIKAEVNKANAQGIWTGPQAQALVDAARDEQGNVGPYESHLIEAAFYAAGMASQMSQQALNVLTNAKQDGTFPTEIQIHSYEMAKSILAGTPYKPEPFNPVYWPNPDEGEFEP